MAYAPRIVIGTSAAPAQLGRDVTSGLQRCEEGPHCNTIDFGGERKRSSRRARFS